MLLAYINNDILEFLKTMIDEFPTEKPVFFSPFSTFSHTPDLIPFKDWENVMKKMNESISM